jgi:hypothetical protein
LLAVTTVKTLALLFVITRSLFDEFGESSANAAFAAVRNIVVDGLHTKSWWEDYWNRVADLHHYDPMAPRKVITISNESRGLFKQALRDSIDKDFARIVAAVVANPIAESLCGDENCELHTETKLAFEVYRPPDL